MDSSQSFSALNERLKPRLNTCEKLYSSLNRLEDKQLGSLRTKTLFNRPTVLPAQPPPTVSVTVTEPEDSEEPEEEEEGDVDLEEEEEEEVERNISDLLPFNNMCLLSELNLKDMGEEQSVDDDSSSTSPSEEKDVPGELASKENPESQACEGGSSVQGSYMDGTLPDLLRNGRPLCRRRTVGHVSATLKEVRREVELSRRRSIKLKAQVDKLQERREGPGWGQQREKVTDEVLSILRILQPLTDASPSESSHRDKSELDAALAQLQSVACTLAVSHNTQKGPSGTKGEDSAILQQALRDRDDAVEKKKAMEAELLRSKTEMMMLNNQLLEAVQKRLELQLELEAWKEDVQLILQHQLQQQQQQAAEAQKKPSRLGLLRRNRPPVQRPPSFASPSPAPPPTNTSQIFISKSAVSAPAARSPSPQLNWRDKLRSRRSGRPAEPETEVCKEDDFHVISLD